MSSSSSIRVGTRWNLIAARPKPNAPGCNWKMPGEKRIARLTQRAAEVRERRSRHDFLFSLVSVLRALPTADGRVEIEAKFLDVTARSAIEGPWKGHPVLIVNLQYGSKPLEPTTAKPPKAANDE